MSAKWKCLVCGYIHEGENPPEVCPICGVGPEQFERIQEVSEQKDNKAVQEPKDGTSVVEPMDRETAIIQSLYAISYGLYIISAHHDGVDNGQCANTCFQITAEPPRIAIGINKNNYTHELITQSGKFGVSVLNQQGHDYVRLFGFRSGRNIEKFADIPNVHRGESGILLLDDVIATVEAEVIGELDAGTHTLFLGEVKAGEVRQKAEPMTYAYYRATK
ncbi:flavin reductase [Desulfitobacterium sp. THU1]|uniref:flavin reductase n=1 Tax=Desulfitobacterium sp. THU1 TaxID=3138072 RepID=UPI0031200402